jgi:hypothetical protein
LDEVFQWARRTHERLLGLPWLVVASTAAMVLVMVLGILMGLPRLRNNLSGWHKSLAWFTLPLIFLSPLTGLCMALGFTFQSGFPVAGRPVSLTEAVELVAASHDLASVTSIGVRGGRMMARIYEGGELRTYSVTSAGVAALPRNWPRLIHEGNWSATFASPLNIVTSVALFGLLTTGLLLWARRQFRRSARMSNGARDRATSMRSVA